jgi:hypothetical protein
MYSNRTAFPTAYQPTRFTGDVDEAPLIVREEAGLEPHDVEPNGPTVKYFGKMKDTVRGHIIAMISEFIGTFMFLFFAYAAAQIGNEKEDSLPLFNAPEGLSLLQISYIAAVFGLSLGVNVWIFYRVSGGMFNPAVCLCFWTQNTIVRGGHHD